MFGKNTRIKLPRWAMIAAVLGLLVIVFELYSMIVPFQSNNPLWTQVTVGQPVIDNWTYGGQDEEGYLRFYNQGQSVVLPPKAKLFSADGQFVVIEGYSPSSLTYALPFEAIPLGWMLLIGVAGATGVWIFLRRRKSSPTGLPSSRSGLPRGFRQRKFNRSFRTHSRASSPRRPRLTQSMGQGTAWFPKRTARFRARASRKVRFRR